MRLSFSVFIAAMAALCAVDAEKLSSIRGALTQDATASIERELKSGGTSKSTAYGAKGSDDTSGSASGSGTGSASASASASSDSKGKGGSKGSGSGSGSDSRSDSGTSGDSGGSGGKGKGASRQ